jgi:hypothetical protein
VDTVGSGEARPAFTIESEPSAPEVEDRGKCGKPPRRIKGPNRNVALEFGKRDDLCFRCRCDVADGAHSFIAV